MQRKHVAASQASKYTWGGGGFSSATLELSKILFWILQEIGVCSMSCIREQKMLLF